MSVLGGLTGDVMLTLCPPIMELLNRVSSYVVKSVSGDLYKFSIALNQRGDLICELASFGLTSGVHNHTACGEKRVSFTDNCSGPKIPVFFMTKFGNLSAELRPISANQTGYHPSADMSVVQKMRLACNVWWEQCKSEFSNFGMGYGSYSTPNGMIHSFGTISFWILRVLQVRSSIFRWMQESWSLLKRQWKCVDWRCNKTNFEDL